MPTEGESLFKSKDEILEQLIEGFITRVPDGYTGNEGNLIMLFEVMADVFESAFLAVSIVGDDLFIESASDSALERRGDEIGRPRKNGTPSTGVLLFTGEGGTNIPEETEVAYDPGTGEDPLYFNTTESGTIPDPGIPTAPSLATIDDEDDVGIDVGTYEYKVTFYTDAGETAAGATSDPVTIAIDELKFVVLSDIPIGGPGTIGRRVYRALDGDVFKLAFSLDDNVTTDFTDTAAEGDLNPVSPPPEVSTAEQFYLTAQSDDVGEKYNLVPNTIKTLTNAPDGVTSVVNQGAFGGGTDTELTEDYREALLKFIRDPGTGSAADLEALAESVDGVSKATAFENDNMGTPTNGHVTVRIIGPGGTVPSPDVQAEVLDLLTSQDLANVSIHVTTFDSETIDVTVSVAISDGYTLDDVTPTVTAAIETYIEMLDVAEPFIISGVIQAVMSTIGISDVTVDDPATNTSGETDYYKFVPGTIEVDEM